MAYGNIIGRHRAICCPRFRTDHFGVTFICPEFRTRHYTPCNNLSQFWHCHCHLCNVMPQISDKLMHTGHFRVPDFRRSYCTPGNIVSEFSNVIAYRATSCPRFRADFCTPGMIVSQIWDRLLHMLSDMCEISDRPLHFWNTMLQNPLIPTENKNELSVKPDISCRFKNAVFQISDMWHRGTVLLLFRQSTDIISHLSSANPHPLLNKYQ